MMSNFSFPPNERSYPRNNITQDAEVIDPDERGMTEVLVRDMSGGASIQLKSSTDLSGEFNLYVTPENRLYAASVRWMRGDVVGLEFKDKPGTPCDWVEPA